MTRTLALTVHRVSDTQLRKCFLGRNPKLYIEIKIKTATSKQSYKTNAKVIRDSDTEWNKLLTFSIEESQTMRILLKATTFFGERVIGEVECKASDLLSPGTAPPQISLKVYRPRDKGKTRSTSTIVTSARYTYSEPNSQELPSSENPRLPSDAPPESPGETQASPSGSLEPPGTLKLIEEPSKVKEVPAETQEDLKEAVKEAQDAAANELGPDSLYGKVGQLRDRLGKLSGIVGTIDKLAELHPWVDLAWQVCSSLYKVVEKQYTTDKKIIDLVVTMEATFGFIEDTRKIEEDAIPLRPIIEDLMKQVAECATFICAYLQPSFMKRMAKGLLTDLSLKIAEFIGAFAKLQKSLEAKVLLHTGFVSSKILGVVEDIREFNILTTLKPADMNAANRPLCLHGTREGVLQRIMDWVENVDDDGQNILWLHGLAGSGKSTIANTIARHTHEIGRRGAFLFFERNKTDRDAVVRTMAVQLADADPFLWSRICAAIDKTGVLLTAPLENNLRISSVIHSMMLLHLFSDPSSLYSML
ncbi:hypothetical protein QCA50_020343 [Cerrena zonata]|uniref:C2 domain-containing protein n=1 Tax=Cerrena zonata TaxID=2478898 RepID=A0AAW0FHD6_9APHY